jgi:hypothetical protein
MPSLPLITLFEAARAIVVEHAGGYGIGLDYARDMIKPA